MISYTTRKIEQSHGECNEAAGDVGEMPMSKVSQDHLEGVRVERQEEWQGTKEKACSTEEQQAASKTRIGAAVKETNVGIKAALKMRTCDTKPWVRPVDFRVDDKSDKRIGNRTSR